MPTTTTPGRVEGTSAAMLQRPTLQWALKRTLLGIVILFVTIATAATLLYASIDPEQEQGGPAFSAPAAADPAYSGAPTQQNVIQSARRV
ncbi:MAG: hypothetical protein WDN31_03635 [Hyphomicrobium sp.]